MFTRRIYKFIPIVISYFYAAFHDLWCYLKDLIYIYFCKDHLRIKSEYKGNLQSQENIHKAAIVALFPSDESLVFTKNLLDALAANGFFTLIVSTKILSNSQQEIVLNRCHHLIERCNIGFDFASYQYGLNWMAKNGNKFGSYKFLLLANDTMYYSVFTKNILASMLEYDKSWQCLFESYEIHHHAQSFFLLFKSEIFLSERFKNFWRKYRPTYARIRTIKNGEIKLSRELITSGFVPYAFFNAAAVMQIVKMQYLAAQENKNYKEFSELLIKLFGKLTKQQLNLIIKDPVNMITNLMHMSNPTHSVGLLVNYFMNAPLKRDVCYRGAYKITDIFKYISNLNEHEICAMQRDLHKKGKPMDLVGMKRLLYARGRI